MTLLNRYIFKSFVKNLSILMASFIAIYVLIDFFEKIDNFSEQGKPIGLVLKFFLLNIPFVMDQMSPVCILLAGVVTLGLLNNSNELIALKAGGIPLYTIAKPIIFAGVVVSLLFLAMSQFILPVTFAETNKIWIEDVQGKVPLGIYRNGRYYYKGQDGFYSFGRVHNDAEKFMRFSYSTWNDKYELTSLIAAKGAYWGESIWNLLKGQHQIRSDQDSFHTEVFENRPVGLPEEPSNFFMPEYHALEQSLLALYKEAKRDQDPNDSNKAWTNFYGRISYTFLGLPLMLLGLPLLLMVYRKWGRDLSIAIPVSCGLAFVCWGGWSTLQSLARASYLNPLAASVSVQIFICLVAAVLLYREDV